jgi:hypothetical protein
MYGSQQPFFSPKADLRFIALDVDSVFMLRFIRIKVLNR